MLIKNIDDFKSIKTISVNKDVYHMLTKAGFSVVNVNNDEYIFLKTEELDKYLRLKGVSDK